MKRITRKRLERMVDAEWWGTVGGMILAALFILARACAATQ